MVGAGVGAVGGGALGIKWIQNGGTRDLAWTPSRIGGHWQMAPLATQVDGVPHYGARLAVTQW